MPNSVTNADTVCTMTKFLIAVVGPTAIGKTTMGIELAKAFQTEIISADSRQFFREMSIGTAVPSEDELNAATHHFIHHKSVMDAYSVGDFEKDALDQLETIFEMNDVAIMVGGSGLYVDAVVKGLDDFPKVAPEIRQELNSDLEKNGLQSLQNRLKISDPVAYQNIEIENPHRVIRALEISIGTGKPYSSFLRATSKKRPFKTIYIGLSASRETIYTRINQRVDKMMEEGLLDEAKSLYDQRHLNALNTVGYKELFNYMDGEWTLDFAISEIKKNTRRFAKRQLTWCRNNEAIHWFDHDTPAIQIVNFLKLKLHKEL